jgi:hypothetical protein
MAHLHCRRELCLQRLGTVLIMKKNHKKTAAPAELGVHVDREDRARTNAGKTINSKVRSEGRAHAALERASLAQRSYLAQEARGVSRA